MDSLPTDYVEELEALWEARAEMKDSPPSTPPPTEKPTEAQIIAQSRADKQRHAAKTRELATGW